jgi:16S rRNA (cytosine1402-N4)-methyltransferase
MSRQFFRIPLPDRAWSGTLRAGMSEPAPKPPRRKRYKGKYPRRFEEKYKEREPHRYPETVAKVIASGKTPAGGHVPIMVDECLDAMALAAGMRGVDCTLGHGGHARRILERISPGGFLLGMDQDPIELPKTEGRLRDAGFGPGLFEVVRSNYAGLPQVLAARGWQGVDFVFADLGCSSMQFDDPARGFSFKNEGPLDMRMNPKKGPSAAEWLARVSAGELEQVLLGNSDEPRAPVLARALAGKVFGTTTELAMAVRLLVPMDEETANLTVRRVFQAVRIAVNEEFTALEMFLRRLPECLASGARVAVLTFHSGEDRRVKKAFQAYHRSGVFCAVSDGVITASPAERRANPRSAPAKLRWAQMA